MVFGGDWTLLIAFATSLLMVAGVKANFEQMNEYRTEYLTLDAAGLLADFPPDFYDRNKRIVYGIGGPQTSGVITVSRWRAMPLPESLGRDIFLTMVVRRRCGSTLLIPRFLLFMLGAFMRRTKCR